jgi:hypothetical protein
MIRGSQSKVQFNLIKNIIKIRLIDTKLLTMKIQIYWQLMTKESIKEFKAVFLELIICVKAKRLKVDN